MPIDALSVSCAQLTRGLLAIAKFLYGIRCDELEQKCLYAYVQCWNYKQVNGRAAMASDSKPIKFFRGRERRAHIFANFV